MEFSAPPRRALALLLTALVGSLVVALVIGLLATGGDDSARRSGSSAGPERGRTAGAEAVRLTGEPGGVSAADISLDDLAAANGTRARRATGVGTDLDTGAVDTDTYSMLGVTWRGGDAEITARTRAQNGDWSSWQELETLTDRPDPADGEGDPDQRATEPVWVGASDGVQVRVDGAESTDATDLELALIEPAAEVVARRAPRKSHKSPLHPGFRTRQDWGADNSLRDGSASYNDTIKQVHIHHTVSSNTYSKSDVPGLIRGMYRYHTQNLGWSDIGYNFLVDRFGRIWTGRAGGPAKSVRGAHTLGFNHASTGISVIGNFESDRPNRKVISALARVAAWKLDKFGRKPRGHTKVTSHGSDRYAFGQKARLRVIDGHRDTNDTACPGTYLYQRIPYVRKRAAARIDRLRRS